MVGLQSLRSGRHQRYKDDNIIILISTTLCAPTDFGCSMHCFVKGFLVVWPTDGCWPKVARMSTAMINSGINWGLRDRDGREHLSWRAALIYQSTV
jgi:hypothetical protein